ncbi:MAG TPA: cytochrome c biogenesis protein CcdA [Patescibacteria group bacterium]|nr:cytochrome c biogenesis protein CcdA [Patescibacteria group bacterium]
MYQVSLIASFFAGMVALFAPCCISYLLPAYLGNIFKEKQKILLMTFVYSVGIFVVLFPVLLGAKVLSNLFFELHDQTYYIGGVIMMGVAFLSLLGLKLPMPHFGVSTSKGQPDILSTFTLGIFSGITSACCAPVVLGVMMLSSFSPTILSSVGVGIAYVLGMVAPLYLASLLIDKRQLFEKPLLKKKLGEIHLGKYTFPIFVSNVVAFFIFATTAVLMVTLTSMGLLGMPSSDSKVLTLISSVAMSITEWTGGSVFLDIIFVLALFYLVFVILKEIGRQKKKEE